MCYYTEQKETLKKVATRFKAEADNPELFLQSDYIVGFEFRNLPIIRNNSPGIISTNYNWGLIPKDRDLDFRRNTLNARIETLEQKPSFYASINNRCLVIATAYFDWHWNDPKGKNKTKYRINSSDDELFAFAGLFANWTDKSGHECNTFTIVTTAANEQMRYIHNRKAAENDQRMPVMLRTGDEKEWLDISNDVADFAYPNYKQHLIGFPHEVTSDRQ